MDLEDLLVIRAQEGQQGPRVMQDPQDNWECLVHLDPKDQWESLERKEK